MLCAWDRMPSPWRAPFGPRGLILLCEVTRPMRDSVRSHVAAIAAHAAPIGSGGQPTSRHVWPEPLALQVVDGGLAQLPCAVGAESPVRSVARGGAMLVESRGLLVAAYVVAIRLDDGSAEKRPEARPGERHHHLVDGAARGLRQLVVLCVM